MTTIINLPLKGKHVLVPIAAPGTGKTTALNVHAAAIGDPAWRFGADDIRQLIFGDMMNQSAPAQVHAAARAVAAARLAGGRSVAYDATNITARDRRQLIELANANNSHSIAVVFQLPLDQVLARNAARDRVVPVDVIEKMHARMGSLTEASLLAEGFSAVHFVDATTEIKFTQT